MGGYALGHYPLSPTVRRGLNRCACGGLALAFLLAAAASSAATYRWTDERGKVHHGDRIPPQYAGQGEAGGQGIKRLERAPNPAEARQRREQEAARKEMDERSARERQRHDSALLATFSNTREIDQARQRALDQEQALLDSLLAQRKHSETKAEADYIDDMIRQRHKALEAIRGKFDADKARYIELTGAR